MALSALILAGALDPPVVRGQSTAPKFEAASIKLCAAGEAGGGRLFRSPARLNVNCETVASLIQLASSGRTFTPVSGGPAWVTSDRYRIDAKTGDAQSQRMMIGPMLQALLEDRFRLKTHHESKEVPVYRMTVAVGGPKLQHATEGACVSYPSKTLVGRPTGQKPMPCGTSFSKKKDAPGIVTVNTRGMSLAAFAGEISHVMDRPVVDKTGVTGMFDLYAEFTLDESIPGLLRRRSFAASDGAPAEPGPSIIAALQKQLGLKLESAKGPWEFLVIDHVERPSDN